MYALDAAYAAPDQDLGYGPSPGKSTLTSRLDGSGRAPVGTAPAPAALLALAGLPVTDAAGFTFVLEASGAFTIIATPPGRETALGRVVPPGSADATLASAWAQLAARISAEHPAPAGAAANPAPTFAALPILGAIGDLISAAARPDDLAVPWLDPVGAAPGFAPMPGEDGSAGAIGGGGTDGGATGPAPQSGDPVGDAMTRYHIGTIIARWMITDDLPWPTLLDLRARVDRALASRPDDHGSLGPDLAAKEAVVLRALLAAPPVMTEAQLAWAHQIIPHQPVELQGDLYQQLQAKSPYANERDNQARWPSSGDKVEAPTGNTCNLTSLAMCLQYLAVPKPTDVPVPAGTDAATLQYEDALFYLWIKLDRPGGNITQLAAWTGLCTALGVTGTHQGGFAGSRASWESAIRDAHLRAGHAVMAGGWGHVVRIQDVTAAGVIVDDPYGGSHRPAASWPDGKNATDGGDGADRGDDCTWPWPTDQIIALPWYFTIAR